MNKKYSTLVATLLLSGTLFTVQAAETTLDGENDPKGIEYVAKSGDITFTDDVDLGNNYIKITKDNAVIDGQGHTLKGRLVVVAEGVVIKNLNIVLENNSDNNTEHKTAISAIASDITIQGCTLTLKGGYVGGDSKNQKALANGITIFASSNDSKINISGNTIISANAVVDQWQSFGIGVYQGLSKTLGDKTTNTKVKFSNFDETSISNNTFVDCACDYVYAEYDEKIDSKYLAIKVTPLVGKSDFANASYIRSLVNNTVKLAQPIFNGKAEVLIAGLQQPKSDESIPTFAGKDIAVVCEDANVLFGGATALDNGKNSIKVILADDGAVVGLDETPGAEIPGMNDVTVDNTGKITDAKSDIPAPFNIGITGVSETKYLAVKDGKIVELTGDDAKDIKDALSAAWTMVGGRLMSVALDKAGVEKKYLGEAPKVLRAATASTSYTLVSASGAATATVSGGALTIGSTTIPSSTLTLSAAATPALSFTTSGGQDLVTGEAASGPYLLSVKQNQFITTGGTTTASNNANALWNVETQKLADGSIYYSFYHMAGTTKTYLSVGGNISFKAYNDLKYNSGVALMVGDQYLTDDGTGALTLGPTFSVIGFFEVGENLFWANELTTKRQTGFDMTIAVSDADDASTDIEGNPFTGILTPVNANYGTAAWERYFYLRNEDGNYIVQDLTATWSGSTEYTLNGTNVWSRGYKFKVVSEKDFKNVVLANPTKYNYIYSVSYSAAKSATDASELFIDVYDGSLSGTVTPAGRLYVAELRNGTATSYLLTTTNGMYAGEHMPYVTFGGSSLLMMKDFLTAPQYYTVAKVDEKGAIVKVLGATAGTAADWYEKGAIQQDQPEGQFAAKKGATDDALVLSNRENPTSEATLTALYKTDKADIYKSGTTYYQIKAVAGHKPTDGYEAWSNKQVRDEQYTIGFYSNVLGAAAYMSENHANKHLVGLDKEAKNATPWKLIAFEGEETATAATDSVYVISDLNFWNKNKKGGAGWDAKKDTLKVITYALVNKNNGEVFDYSITENAYISNPSISESAAPRFAVKKMADGKYNLIKVDPSTILSYHSLGANKLFGGFSVAQGNVNETGKYSKTENDLVVLEKAAAPEYVKLNMGDKIRIFREGSEASLLFEKGEFLGMENVFEFTKMAPAMYVDTAYYNRPDNNRWEYLLAVDPKQVTSETSCSDPTHGVHKADTVFGRFLVNLVDSAYANKNLHNNKYLNTEGYAKLGFVKGFHTNDTLVIQRAGAEKAAKADSLFLGSADPSFAKFAFRVVDNETGAFKIETAYKPSWNSNANLTKGYLKWMNGIVVVIDNENNADIFNLKATDENPTANEAIEASAVQVIAGKGVVTVQGAAGKVVTVANILGQTIANQVAASDNVTIAAPAGVLVVTVDGEATKVVVK